jgi:hypothetical protein
VNAAHTDSKAKSAEVRRLRYESDDME